MYINNGQICQCFFWHSTERIHILILSQRRTLTCRKDEISRSVFINGNINDNLFPYGIIFNNVYIYIINNDRIFIFYFFFFVIVVELGERALVHPPLQLPRHLFPSNTSHTCPQTTQSRNYIILNIFFRYFPIVEHRRYVFL